MGMSEVLGPDLWPVVVWCLLCPASANIATLSLVPGRQYPIRQWRFLLKPPGLSICYLFNGQKGLCSWLFLTCRGLNYFPDNLLREMCGAGRILRIYPSISILSRNANVSELGRRMVTVGLCRARRHAIDLPASGLCRKGNKIVKWNIQNL